MLGAGNMKFEIDAIYEEILYTFLHGESLKLDRKLELSTLLYYMKNAFKVDDTFHDKILKLAHRREPPILRVDVKCDEAESLRSKSVGGTGNYMVNIYKNSAPDHIYATEIQFDTSHPKWTDLFSIPIIRRLDNDCLVFQVYNCNTKETDSSKADSASESGSIRGLKSLIKEFIPQTAGGKNKKLVGKTTVPLESIPTEGIDLWLKLEKKGNYNNRGMIHVNVHYTAEKAKDVSLDEFQCLVHHLLLYELHGSGMAEHWWDGKFTEPGEALLKAYLSRVNLSDLYIAIAKWTAYSKAHVQHQLSFTLFDSLLATFLNSLDNIVDEGIMKYIWEGAGCLLPSCFETIQNQVSNNIYNETLRIVLNILSKIQQLIDRVPGGNHIFHFSLFEALNNAVIDGSNSWFDRKIDELNITRITDSENVSKLRRFIQLLKDELSDAIQLNESFMVFNNFQFAETRYLVYDEKLAFILKEVLNDTDEDWQFLYVSVDQPDVVREAQEKSITVALFQLYLTLKELIALGTKTTVEVNTLQLNQCQNWFSGAITHWLELGMEKALTRIENAVRLDNLKPDHEDAKYSSSAIHTLKIFYQVKFIWDQLEWSDDLGSFMIIGKIIYDICRLCAFYANKIQESLELLHLNHKHNQTNFKVTQQWCLAINNIEFIRAKLNTFINEISIDHMINRITNLYNSFEGERAAETFENIMEYINDIKNYTILHSITQVVHHLTSTIKSNLLEVVKSRNFQSQCITDLLAYIDESMYTMRSDLNLINFERSIELLWEQLIQILEEVIGLANYNRNSPQFYLELKHFFHNIVYIVTLVRPTDEQFMENCSSLQYIDNLLRLHGLETPDLIHQYHIMRLGSQKEQFDACQAMLSVRCHFNENELIVEILNARNLEAAIPENDKKCNPIVKMQILPLDRHNVEFATKLHKNTTVPLLDETFVINLQPEDRLDDKTLILFTVWNRSLVFKTDQFLGECYLAIKDIPKRFEEKQTHLNLSYECFVVKTVLNIIESRRRYDGKAQLFVNRIPRRYGTFPKCCLF